MDRERKERERRERTKALLAESQKRRDYGRHVLSNYDNGENDGVVDVDDEGPSGGKGGGQGGSFDGVRIDAYVDSKTAQYVSDVARRLGTGRPVDDENDDVFGYVHGENDDNARTRDGRKNYRGKKHAGSAMAGPLSSSSSSSSSSFLSHARNGGQRMLRGRAGFGREGRDRDVDDDVGGRPNIDANDALSFRASEAHGEDTLDEAISQQEADRHHASSSSHSSSSIRDVMSTTPQKVKNFITQAMGNVTQTMGNAMDRAMQMQLGGGSMATKRGRQVEAALGRRHNPPMEEGRKSTADVALERRTWNEIGGRRGEKRKTMHRSDSVEVVRCPRKRNENSSAAVALDDSVELNTDTNDGDDYDMNTTIAACERRLNSNEIPKKSTPPFAYTSDFGVMRCPERNGSNIKSDRESRRYSA
jgi:hypothetical protein